MKKPQAKATATATTRAAAIAAALTASHEDETPTLMLPALTSRKRLARAVNTITQELAAGRLSANAAPILRALELAERNFAPRVQKVVHLQVATQLQEGEAL